MDRPIYIIGKGAIGSALAVCLINAGKEAVLIRGSVDGEPDTIKTLRLNLPGDEVLSAAVRIKTFSSLDQRDVVFVLTSKAFGNRRIADKLAHLAIDQPVVLLQNGLNIERPFLERGFKQLHRCVLLVTSQFEKDGVLRFRPVAPCPIAGLDGNQDLSAALVGQLHTSWFPFRQELQIDRLVWQKTIINCVFNSVCPLLEIDNGIFDRDPDAMVIADQIIAEGVLVSRSAGIELDAAEIRQTLLSISRASDGQFISTLQDIRSKRPTEIQSLNQEVAAVADSMGLAGQVVLTRTLGELIALKNKDDDYTRS